MSDASVDHMVETYLSMSLVMAFRVSIPIPPPMLLMCFEYLDCLACFCCCDFYGCVVCEFGLMFMGSVMLSICSDVVCRIPLCLV